MAKKAVVISDSWAHNFEVGEKVTFVQRINQYFSVFANDAGVEQWLQEEDYRYTEEERKQFDYSDTPYVQLCAEHDAVVNRIDHYETNNEEVPQILRDWFGEIRDELERRSAES